MDLGLEGRRALVTAASSGIGKACAAALAAEGARVFVSARNPEPLEAAAREIGAAGWLASDVTQENDSQELIQAAAHQLGGLDILVTNVPDPQTGGFADAADDSFTAAHEATLMSVVRLVRLVRPLLADSPAGRIVNISSIAAHEWLAGRLFSATYRSALAALAKHLSIELAPHEIAVNTIAPGNIITPLWDEESASSAAESVPLGRLGDAHEIGSLCAYLCSVQAAYITGQSIVVDGGLIKTIP
ncbi:MAG TPA: SDR family oxidoreductase [Actinomycetota bacterium]|jgi:3-oxoacyl-[acyl-carrier protein] reductase|nr:SDR family oxidoreductase [Actinomycetota bacterium]